MNPLDILWLGAIGAAFVMLLIVTLIFVQQEGRTRIYLSAILAAFTIHALVSLITAIQTEIVAFGFKMSRSLSWALIALTGLFMVLYQLQIINGRMFKKKKS